MPSRKQRRRREKLARHEYEYVIETEDGEEIPIDKPVESEKANKAVAKSAPRPTRGGREVPKPSMARVFKRTAIFAPIILVVVFWTGGDSTTSAKIFTGVTLVAFFIPFSYIVDSVVYRMYSKRQQRGSGPG
jgi:hypothetical protein